MELVAGIKGNTRAAKWLERILLLLIDFQFIQKVTFNGRINGWQIAKILFCLVVVKVCWAWNVCFSFLFSAFPRSVFRSNKYLVSYARYERENSNSSSLEVSVIVVRFYGEMKRVHKFYQNSQLSKFQQLKKDETRKKRETLTTDSALSNIPVQHVVRFTCVSVFMEVWLLQVRGWGIERGAGKPLPVTRKITFFENGKKITKARAWYWAVAPQKKKKQ